MATSNITFETAEFDFHVTATTDVVPFSCSRQLPPPDGDVESDKRLLYESPDSEAKMSVQYTVETFSGRDRLVSQIRAGRTSRPLRGAGPYPLGHKTGHETDSDESIGKQETLTTNLIVDK